MAQPRKRYLFFIISLFISVSFLSLCGVARCETLFKESAIEYRQKGYEAQAAGMLGEALIFYQKAIQMDPMQAAVYNDIGVIYEMQGDVERAEQAYFMSANIDPGYVKAYFNLAQLYEGEGDLWRASEQWIKVTEASDREDPMAQKAENRIYEIGKLYPEVGKKYLQSQISLLSKDMEWFKQRIAPDTKALAQYYIANAKNFAKKRDNLKALRLYLDAKQLDPQNDQLDSLIEETQRKVLLR